MNSPGSKPARAEVRLVNPADRKTAEQLKKERALEALVRKRQLELEGDDASDAESSSEDENGAGDEELEEKKEEKKSRRQLKGRTAEQGDRTVFIGNLSVAAAEKVILVVNIRSRHFINRDFLYQAGVKDLKAMFAKHGTIESFRFRSVVSMNPSQFMIPQTT